MAPQNHIGLKGCTAPALFGLGDDTLNMQVCRLFGCGDGIYVLEGRQDQLRDHHWDVCAPSERGAFAPQREDYAEAQRWAEEHQQHLLQSHRTTPRTNPVGFQEWGWLRFMSQDGRCLNCLNKTPIYLVSCQHARFLCLLTHLT